VNRTEVIDRLRASGCVFAEEEAAVLIGAAGSGDDLAALVERRAAGEPLEQVVGYADFCGVRVRLRPGVFVPRVRSELLVRLAVDESDRRAVHENDRRAVHENDRPARNENDRPARDETDRENRLTVVDLCCGSGALGMAVRHRLPAIALFSSDLDPVAVATARDNLPTPVFQGDLFTALPPELQGRVDVLLANVPYVATDHLPLLPSEARDHEPRSALDGGSDGLDIFRRIVAEASIWLAPGGVLLSEITAAQLEAATEAVNLAGLDASSIYDDDLEARVIRGRRPR
jgi:release factor glutamine methyltransferase